MHIRLPSGEPVEITTVAERPQLSGVAIDAGEWPAFMRHNRVAEAYFWQTPKRFPDICLVATTSNGTADGSSGWRQRPGWSPAHWHNGRDWTGLPFDEDGQVKVPGANHRHRFMTITKLVPKPRRNGC